MKPIIDHIHITVKDLDRAEKYYDRLLPLFGFDLLLKEYDEEPKHDYKIIEYHHKMLSLGLVNERENYRCETVNRRKPGSLHHIAFQADSNEQVDELYHIIKEISGTIVSHQPKYYPEYCSDYYAFFFKDSEGIEIEIVHFERSKYFLDK